MLAAMYKLYYEISRVYGAIMQNLVAFAKQKKATSKAL